MFRSIFLFYPSIVGMVLILMGTLVHGWIIGRTKPTISHSTIVLLGFPRCRRVDIFMLHWGEGHLLPAVRTRRMESVLVLDILEWTVLFFDRIITLLPALPPQAHVCPALRLHCKERRRRWVYLNEDEVATDLVGELEAENFEGGKQQTSSSLNLTMMMCRNITKRTLTIL